MVHLQNPQMKLNIVKFLILILLISSCTNQKRELKEYGYAKKESDSSKVSLRLGDFITYGDFVDRIHEVTCNDSIPRIVIETKKNVRHIYPTEYCEPFIFDPAGKHYVTCRKLTWTRFLRCYERNSHIIIHPIELASLTTFL